MTKLAIETRFMRKIIAWKQSLLFVTRTTQQLLKNFKTTSFLNSEKVKTENKFLKIKNKRYNIKKNSKKY